MVLRIMNVHKEYNSHFTSEGTVKPVFNDHLYNKIYFL